MSSEKNGVRRSSIRDLPRSDVLKNMISESCWIPEKSGWRPFRSAEESAILDGEMIVARGCNWGLEIVSLGETSGVFHESLGYTDAGARTREITYEELFRWYKVASGNIPCGMPI